MMEPSYGLRNSYVFLVGSFVLISFLSLLMFFFYDSSITGHASSDLELLFSPQRKIAGIYTYTLEEGDTLPDTVRVKLAINSLEREISLASAIVDKSILTKVGPIVFNSLVKVEIRLEKITDQGGSQSAPIGGSYDPSPDEDGEFSGGANSEGGFGSNSGGFGNPPATGSVTDEGDRHLTVYIREGEVASYPLSGVKPVVEGVWRVRDNMPLENSNVHLVFNRKQLTVTTSYLEQTTGFSFPSVTNIAVDLSKFPQPIFREGLKNVVITLKNGQEVINSEKRSIVVSSNSFGSGSSSSSLTDDSLNQGKAGNHVGRRIAPLVLDAVNGLCENEFCGPFGPCSIPSLAQTNVNGFIALTPMMSQQCVCQDNQETYTRAQACSQGDTNYQIIPYSGSQKSRTLDVLNARTHEPTLVLHPPWKESFTYNFQDLATQGHISRELAIGSRFVINIRGESHNIGVVAVRNGKFLIEGASVPEQAWIGQGEFSYFVKYNGEYSLKASVIKVNKDKALVRIEPIQESNLMEVGENERGVTIIDSQLNQPVARVIFNGDLPSLDVILLQSPDLAPVHCSNNLKDQDESGADCGGAYCKKCRVDRFNFLPLALWLSVSGLALALIIYRRQR